MSNDNCDCVSLSLSPVVRFVYNHLHVPSCDAVHIIEHDMYAASQHDASSGLHRWIDATSRLHLTWHHPLLGIFILPARYLHLAATITPSTRDIKADNFLQQPPYTADVHLLTPHCNPAALAIHRVQVPPTYGASTSNYLSNQLQPGLWKSIRFGVSNKFMQPLWPKKCRTHLIRR